MSKGNRAVKNSAGNNNVKTNGAMWLPNTLYVISAVIAVIFVYMVIVNIIYIKNYLASYGMAFSDMRMDSIQYILTGSTSYLVYAILVFCAGKLISMAGAEKAGALQEMTLAKGAEPAGERKALDRGTDLTAGGAKEPEYKPQGEAEEQADAGKTAEAFGAREADFQAGDDAEAQARSQEESRKNADTREAAEEAEQQEASQANAGTEAEEESQEKAGGAAEEHEEQEAAQVNAGA